MTPRRSRIAIAIALAHAFSAGNTPAQQTIPENARRLGLGAQLGVPWGDAAPIPAGVGARLTLSRLQAVAVGIGAPVPTLGLGFWADYQLSTNLGFLGARLSDVEPYVGLGAQVGFLGPSYYARKYNSYVGFQYIYSSNGEFALALRVPIGLRVLFFQRHFEIFGEAETTFLVNPSNEFLIGAAFGSRYYF